MSMAIASKKNTSLDSIQDHRVAAGEVAVLYDRHWTELCRYVKRTFGVGPPEPEDVAQTAFTRFVQLERPQDVENPWAFLLRTAHNVAVSELRRTRVYGKYLVDGIHHISEDRGNDRTEESVFIEREQFTIVRQALAKMPHKRRRVLLLHRIYELSLAEIGRRERMTGPAVGKHLRRALADIDVALKNIENRR